MYTVTIQLQYTAPCAFSANSSILNNSYSVLRSHESVSKLKKKISTQIIYSLLLTTSEEDTRWRSVHTENIYSFHIFSTFIFYNYHLEADLPIYLLESG